jgi:hypothetical protein
VEIAEGAASIRTERIAAIPSMPEGLEPFSRLFVELRISSILERKLESFLVPAGEARRIAGAYADAYLAFSRGDESPRPGEDAFPPGIRSLGGLIAARRYSGLLKSLWRDLPPADNDLRVDLGRP